MLADQSRIELLVVGILSSLSMISHMPVSDCNSLSYYMQKILTFCIRALWVYSGERGSYRLATTIGIKLK